MELFVLFIYLTAEKKKFFLTWFWGRQKASVQGGGLNAGVFGETFFLLLSVTYFSIKKTSTEDPNPNPNIRTRT